ncbi:MAG: hypothetical protein K9H25_22160 [Rhodospirillum sp.]|nr:hypothetical protein [Rhodospirillum sp.]MCF8491808.1 hypothetical protein [Rhodospirillum sp.]
MGNLTIPRGFVDGETLSVNEADLIGPIAVFQLTAPREIAMIPSSRRKAAVPLWRNR